VDPQGACGNLAILSVFVPVGFRRYDFRKAGGLYRFMPWSPGVAPPGSPSNHKDWLLFFSQSVHRIHAKRPPRRHVRSYQGRKPKQ